MTVTGSKRALLCDADGTILSSWEWIMGAVAHTGQILGFPVPRAFLEFHFFAGTTLRDFYRVLAPRLDPDECIRVHTEYQEKHLELIAPFPGVEETLRLLNDRGVALGIVTSRTKRDFLFKTLKRFNLASLFGTIVTLEDVSSAKPNPEGILLALERLRASKENAFFIGDTSVDIRAGKNAGVRTIGALYGFVGENLRKENADYYVQNFSEVKDIVLYARRKKGDSNDKAKKS